MNPKTSKNSKHYDLRYRALINGISALLIACLIFFAGYPYLRWIFTSAVAAIAGVALWEFYQLVKKKNLEPAVNLGVFFVILYVFAVFAKTQSTEIYFESLWKNAPDIILALALFGCFVFFTILGKSPITNISTTFLGIIYLGVPLGLLVQIMYFFSGTENAYYRGSWWIVYLIATAKIADVGGYFIGRHFGKRKLAMKLSPNKTLEGALGGLLASIAMSVFITFLGKKLGYFPSLTYVSSIWLGGLIGILGQTGDLAESLLKRDAGVKDSNSIPGVGGILDMVDSLLFTAPVVYMFLRILYT